MRKVIKNLLSDIDLLNTENLTFYKNRKSHTGTGWVQWGEYEEWIKHNILTINSVEVLVREKRYRDSYVLLRSVLEAYLVIRLTMSGNKSFVDTRRLKRKNKESKEDLFNRLLNGIPLDPKLNIVSKKLIHLQDDNYTVRIIYKKPPIQNTKEFVPDHYFFFQEYNPDQRYISNPIRKNLWIDIDKDEQKKHKKRHKEIGENFLDFKSLLKHFTINKFATPRQIDAIAVHYNYLSKFVHSTANSYRSISLGKRIYYNDSEEDINNIAQYDFYHELLILLYCNFLSLYFLELQLEYFLNESDIKIHKEYKKKLQRIIKEINRKYNFFWFIKNKPHEFDVFDYKFRKEKLNNKNFKLPYNDDPLKRLKNLDSDWRRPDMYNRPSILVD